MRKRNEFPIFQVKKGFYLSPKLKQEDQAVRLAKRIGGEVWRFEYEERAGGSFGVLKEKFKP